MQKKAKEKKVISAIISSLLIFLGLFLICATKSFKELFSNVTIDELIFHLKVPLEGSNSSFVSNFFSNIIIYLVISLVISLLIFIYHFNFFKHKYEIKFDAKIFNKKINKKIIIKNDRKKILIGSIFFLLISIIYFGYTMKIDQYISNMINKTKLYDEYYVDPKNTKIKFPEKKRNVIYIFAESLETSFVNLEIDGVYPNNLIPNMEKVARENINFSNLSDDIGGGYNASGASWTVAAMVAQTSGIPLKISITENSMDKFSEFLPGVYSLGELLKENGYKNYLMMGSKAEFGGRKNYFEQHGDYEILDYNKAIETGKIPSDYFEWWGYEDKKLFEFAKEELLEISKKDEPFNFSMITADTHPIEGYTDSSCEKESNVVYANSVICSDKMLYEFIEWIKQQDFYENTTIIISGDHLLMSNASLFPDNYPKDRRIYNAIINSAVEKNNDAREFNSMDMFPTTLAAMGVEIEGDRLGLGTNLFSNRKTLSEELGQEQLYLELSRSSNYYDNNFIYVKK